MSKDEFFNEQSELTATKIAFYRGYIKQYLIILLMCFGKCFIADLFCGPGKNGEEDGSPLVLIDESIKILEAPSLIAKFEGDAKITILFSDKYKEKITELKETLSDIEIPDKIKIIPRNLEFSEAMKKIKDSDELKDKTFPKFFFLDPFGYTNITIDDIESLMGLPCSEVLLFIPALFIYRVAGGKKVPEKTKIFLETFTSNGNVKYENPTAFCDSIKEKLLESPHIKYVVPILIDGGSSQNSLIYLTTHPVGCLEMLKLLWSKSRDGKSIKTKRKKKKKIKIDDNQLEMFEKEITEQKIEETVIGECVPIISSEERISSFGDKLEKELSIKGKMTNKEIIEFGLQEGFLPKHANERLSILLKSGKIEPKYIDKERHKTGLYVSAANWNNTLCIVKYINNESSA